MYVIGQPLFVTFRLHGSLPVNRVFPSKTVTSGKAFVAMDRFLDEARIGPTYLKRPDIAQLVVNSLYYGADIGHYELHTWVIMSNHVHLLFTPGLAPSKPLCSLKTGTARKANLLLSRTGTPFWQDESYEHLVRTAEEFRRIQRYIENNPVKVGLVGSAEDYKWSSAGRR